MNVSTILTNYKNGILTSSEVRTVLQKLYNSESTFDLSDGQQGLWALQKMFPETNAYNVPLCVSIADLNVELFKLACELLIRQQEILRVTFGECDGKPYQRVKADTTLFFEHEKVTGKTQAQVLEYLREKVSQVFWLDKEILRVHLLTVENGETIVLLVVHHIVIDGVSARILLRSLLAIYSELQNGGKLDLSPPTKNYFDFVKLEQVLLASDEGRARLGYWKKILSGCRRTTALPTDRPRIQAKHKELGRVYSTALPGYLNDQVLGLSGELGCYASTVFLSVFKVLLHKYTGETDLIVGMPVNQHEHCDLHEVLGYFVNMISIRSELQTDSSLSSILFKVQRTIANGILNSYPFPALVRELGLAGSNSTTPIFQLAFVFQDVFDDANYEKLAVRKVDGIFQAGEYELVLDVAREGKEFVVNWKFDPELYNEDTIERLADFYFRLLDVLTRFPETNISDCFLENGLQNHVNPDNYAMPMNYPKEKGIHQLFEEQVERTPLSVALEYGHEKITYTDLNFRSENVATLLLEKGFETGGVVALCMSRSTDMLAVLLGILKAGGAYVPIDPAFPRERQKYILNDSKASFLIVEEKSISEFRDSQPQLNVLSFTTIFDCSEVATGKKPVEFHSNQLMYILYTSGSTGKPKGVMLEHKALCNRLTWMQNHYEIDSSDVFLQKTPFTFDVSVWELFLPLICGAKLVILPPEDHKDPYKVRDVIQHHKITNIHFVPSMLQVFLEIDNIEACTTLKRVFCSGEALTPNQNNRFFTRLKSELHNLYGPTEAAIDVSYYPCHPGIKDNVPIGKPIANTQLYIVDNNLQMLGVGVSGELCIAGDNLARGYMNRPDLTTEKFIDNPFARGSKLYRTGDLARWNERGDIEYLGRMDTQVKVRGFRIELGEIESQLNTCEGVSDSAVVVREHYGQKQIVAYYVMQKTAADVPGSQHLKTHLQKTLPDYMLPDFYVELSSFPLSANGKLDRNALSQRKLERANSTADESVKSELTVPENNRISDIEDKLSVLWKTVLNIDALSIDEGFFDVGGNSLLAVVLSDRISREFNIIFRASMLFHYATIRQLAAYLLKECEEQYLSILNERAPSATGTPMPSDKRFPQSKAKKTYQDDLAIIGLSCCLPGADNYHQFWSNLCEGKESARFYSPAELRGRGIEEALIANSNFVPVEQSIVGKDLFDSSFFNIAPKNAALMDPQFRLLLQHAWQAVEDAGYVAEDIPQTGVFMSASNHYYQSILCNSNSISESDEYVAWVLAQGGTIPTMISFELGLTGPSLFVHSNCSSSLVALSLACNSLTLREADCALVGAATVTPTNRIGYIYRPGLNFSGDGHCKTFDADADGLTPGEGVAVMMVKRAQEAINAGDHIYALIRGIAVNNDGAQKAGFYAPSTSGQMQVIDNVIKKTGVDPRTIGYMEAHGTGTRLGDPIEFSALTKTFQAYTVDKNYCGLGSVKSNIGHLDAAAGLVGCIKLALSLKHGIIVPTINYKAPNPEIDFENSPFYIATKTRSWESEGAPRCGAISSFGLGGTNAHAILEEYRNEEVIPSSEKDKSKAFIFPLSAKSSERLSVLTENLLHFLNKEQNKNISLEQLSFTLQVGRVAMACRVVFICRSLNELLDGLQGFIDGNAALEGCYKGEVNISKPGAYFDERDDDVQETISKWIHKGKLSKLAKFWVNGGLIDWKLLYLGCKPKRISLPTYPFAQESHWVESTISLSPSRKVVAEQIHPLVHKNTSTIFDTRFTSTFKGTEIFFVEQLGARKLSAEGLLDMARVAAAAAIGMNTNKIIRLYDIAWLHPLLISDDPLEVHISLNPLDERSVEFDIYSLSLEGEIKLYTQGHAGLQDMNGDKSGVDLSALKKHCDGDPLQSLSEIVLSKEKAAAFKHCGLLPELFECALRNTDSGISDFAFPEALQSVTWFKSCPENIYIWTRRASQAVDQEVVELDLDLCDRSGELCISFKGLQLSLANENLVVAQAAEKNSASTEMSIAKTVEVSKLMCFEEVWTATDLTLDEARTQTLDSFEEGQTLLCFLSGRNEQQALTKSLQEQFIDKDVFFVEYGSGESDNQVSEASVDAFLKIMNKLHSEGRKVGTLIYLWPTEDSRWLRDTSAIVALIQALAETNLQIKQFLIAGLYRDGLERCYLESWSAFERSLSLVLPRVQAGLLIHEHSPENDAMSYGDVWVPSICRALSTKALQSVLKRGETWYTQKIEAREVDSKKVAFDSLLQGTILITGGCGGLGKIFSKHLAQKAHPVNLILTGRSALGDSQKAQVDQLQALGCEVLYLPVDVCDREALTVAIAKVKQRFGSITGVIHAAGIEGSGVVLNKTSQAFEEVLAPKIIGTQVLDEVLLEEPLNFICYFSSSSAILGDFGSCDYAMANRFQMAYAAYRNALQKQGKRKGKALAICWPLWKDGGMSGDETQNTFYLKSSGQDYLESKAGLSIFESLLHKPQCQHLVIVGQPSRVNRFPGMLPKTEESVSKIAEAGQLKARGRRSEMREMNIPQCVAWDLAFQIREYLKIPQSRLHREDNLADLGFDSISLTEFARILSAHYGFDIMPQVFFGYSTLDKLCEYFLSNHYEAMEQFYRIENKVETSSVPPLKSQRKAPLLNKSRRHRDKLKQEALKVNSPIAIIGMSGRFPQASNIEQYWDNLLAGRDCITLVPESRWIWQDFFGDPIAEQNKTNVKWGGFIEGVDLFDPLFFGISPAEAVSLDPHQRLVLMHAWAAIEDAGYAPGSLSGSDTAVFIGTMSSGYSDIVFDAGMPLEGHIATGLSISVGPARISYLLNLHGACEPIDTACSSSLVAIHRAVEVLRQNKSSLALAGGVSTMLTPALHICLNKAGMLSESGRCKTFSDAADGYGRGEGVGMIVLKPLPQAEQDGDNIYAVILGSAVNHGGRANSLTAPNSKAQAELLVEAYKQAGIDPRTVSYIEAHGTGTKLGDPVEIDGIKSAFKKLYQDVDTEGQKAKPRCGLGSVKTNIGHLEHSAGVAALIKVLMQIKHKTLVKSLHSEVINPYIDLKDSPFYIVQEKQDWETIFDRNNKPIPRRAGVSSFGFGGVNAHLVVEEYTPEKSLVSEINKSQQWLLILSAKSVKQLRGYAKKLLAFLERDVVSDRQLASLCFTLQLGREALEERAATIVDSVLSLKTRLEELAQSKSLSAEEISLWHFGSKNKSSGALVNIEDDEDVNYLISNWVAKEKYNKVLDFWVKGGHVDWRCLYEKNTLPRRMSLPTYPFKQTRYWPRKINSMPVKVQVREKNNSSWMPDEKVIINNELKTYVPVWNPIEIIEQNQTLLTGQGNSKTILIVHDLSPEMFQSKLKSYCQKRELDATIISICLGGENKKLSENDWVCQRSDPKALSAVIDHVKEIKAVYFLSLDYDYEGSDLAARDLNNFCQIELQFFALIKGLSYFLSKCNGKQTIDLYVMTLDHSAGLGYQANFRANGLNGLAYSVAQSEPNILVRNIDLSKNDVLVNERHEDVIQTVHSLAPNARGTRYKIDSGRAYAQSFTKLRWPTKDSFSALKHQGVYVILGGSGVVGRVITKSLIEKYRANVVWIASSPVDSVSVKEKIAECSFSSLSPDYIQADATQLSSLTSALKTVKCRYSRIDGAIFAVSPTGPEISISDMSNSDFKSGFDKKSLTGVNFYSALENEKIDFLCYFSSVQAFSFISAANTSSYAAGICFLDNFVSALSLKSNFPVGIVNWGYWQATYTNSLLHKKIKKYFGLIDDDKGFEVFEKFTTVLESGKLNQITCLDPSPLIEDLMGITDREMLAPTELLAKVPREFLSYALGFDWSEKLREALPDTRSDEIEKWITDLLYTRLCDIGVFPAQEGWVDIHALRKKAGIIDKYASWWEAWCMPALEAGSYIIRDGAKLKSIGCSHFDIDRKQLASRTERYLADKRITSMIDLVCRCIRNIEDILTGRLPATNVFFPVSSMENIEEIYKNNSISFHFNEVVAEMLRYYIESSKNTFASRGARIIEVGAGTGGTTEIILSKLETLKSYIAEYCFTDVSKAFLIRGRKRYLESSPFLNFKLWNVENSASDQDIPLGSYDILVATNVLHATKNIRETLRNIKAVLKRNGVIILNELIRKTNLQGVTFGLLDGWWKYDDDALRINGSPLLSEETWKRVLREEGFYQIQIANKAPAMFGQQVLIAVSDGFILDQCAKTNKASVLQGREKPCINSEDKPAYISLEEGGGDSLKSKKQKATKKILQKVLTDFLADTCDVLERDISVSAPFSDYGIDSILGLKFIGLINSAFDIELNSIVIYDYPNVDKLAKYLYDFHANELSRYISGLEFSGGEGKFNENDKQSQGTEVDFRVNGPFEKMGKTSCLIEIVVDSLVSISGIQKKEIKNTVPISEYGVDSILGIMFVRKINTTLGTNITPATIYNYPTVKQLCDHIVDIAGEEIKVKELVSRSHNPYSKVEGSIGNTSSGATSVFPHGEGEFPKSTTSYLNSTGEHGGQGNIHVDDIAVIGMSLQCPKANNADEFWQNLVNGKNCTEELPHHYLDQNLFYSETRTKGKTYCKWGGVVEGRYAFDPSFFNIPEHEAPLISPHQRLFMLEAWKAIEDAGYNPKTLENQEVGLFLGAEPLGDHSVSFTGSSDAITASRLSYQLNLKGPAFVVNTGCSSSAVAIHLACESLRQQESDLVVVGGVFATLGKETLISLSRTEMLSRQGKCRPLDAASDGTIISEGVAAIVLKRRDKAAADRDSIYGVIKASGINQDGASNGITAPNGQSQERLMTKVYERFGISVENIGYVETHGTGTPLGDSIEVNALIRTFKKFTAKQGFCTLGCTKANIGHTMSASGVLGLIRILLSMKNRKIPKLINYETINPSIELNGSAFQIVEGAQDWCNNSDKPLTAALNSFGHSGTNAHLVIQEHKPVVGNNANDNPVPENSSFLVPLSANSQEGLRSYAKQLFRRLELCSDDSSEQLELSDLAYTLQLGRDSMIERVAFLVSSISDLKDALQQFISGDKPDNVWQGKAEEDYEDEFEIEHELERIEVLASAWVCGAKLNWQSLYWSSLKPKRVHLPTYPFSAKVYPWVGLKDRNDFSFNLSQPENNKVKGTNSIGKKSSAIDLPLAANAHDKNGFDNPGYKARTYLRHLLSRQLGRVLSSSEESVAMYDLGVSSSDIVSMTREINKSISSTFMAEMFFKYRTIKEISKYFVDNYLQSIQDLEILTLYEYQSLSDTDRERGSRSNTTHMETLQDALSNIENGSMGIGDVISRIDRGVYS